MFICKAQKYKVHLAKFPAFWKLSKRLCELQVSSCPASCVLFSNIFYFASDMITFRPESLADSIITHCCFSNSAIGSSFFADREDMGLSLTGFGIQVSWNVLLCLHQIKTHNLELMPAVLLKVV